MPTDAAVAVVGLGVCAVEATAVGHAEPLSLNAVRYARATVADLLDAACMPTDAAVAVVGLSVPAIETAASTGDATYADDSTRPTGCTHAPSRPSPARSDATTAICRYGSVRSACGGVITGACAPGVHCGRRAYAVRERTSRGAFLGTPLACGAIAQSTCARNASGRWAAIRRHRELSTYAAPSASACGIG